MGRPLREPTDVVRHLLAVQSQDYPGAKWALAQRAAAPLADSDLDAAFDRGEFVRTHVMRPTWHFVAADDLRWLLALTRPRVHQANAYQYRQLEIDDELAARAARVFEAELAGGRARTRVQLGGALASAGIEASGLRLGYLLAHAELEGTLCSGPRAGKGQTYALLEERLPPAAPRTREEALAELGRRYVEGHGPAQVGDLSWWSGLTMADARRALESATPPLRRTPIGERTFWTSPEAPHPALPSRAEPSVHLLPNYDELLIAFRDRSDAADPALPDPARAAEFLLAHIIVRDGLVVGGWRRRDSGPVLNVEPAWLVEPGGAERRAFDAAVARLSAFLGRPVEVAGRD